MDTSVFESENFLEGHKLLTLFDLAEEGNIVLLMPRITYTEVIARMRRNLSKAKDYINSIRAEYKSVIRIAKNVNYLKANVPLPGINVNKDLAALQEKLSQMLAKAKAITVSNENVSIDQVFEKYFQGDYPFHKSDKKHEFPDAFALASIEKWCKENGETCYVLSLDNDMLNYNSEYIYPVSSIAIIIDAIQRDKHRKMVELVDEIMKRERLSLLHEAKEKIEELLYEAGEELEYDSGFEAEEVQDVKMSDVTITDYQIIELTSTKAIVECDCRFNFVVQIIGEDFSEAVYDSEDREFFGVKNVTDSVSGKMAIRLKLAVVHGVPKESQMILIDEINDGFPIDLSDFQ